VHKAEENTIQQQQSLNGLTAARDPYLETGNELLIFGSQWETAQLPLTTLPFFVHIRKLLTKNIVVEPKVRIKLV